jgi:hypothetical protein
VRANKIIAKHFLLATILMAASGCASEFEKRFAEAERIRAEAAAAGSEWLETGALLEQARAAADQDNMGAALLLVEEARLQGELAIKQAQHEADSWADRVVK